MASMACQRAAPTGSNSGMRVERWAWVTAAAAGPPEESASDEALTAGQRMTRYHDLRCFSLPLRGAAPPRTWSSASRLRGCMTKSIDDAATVASWKFDLYVEAEADGVVTSDELAVL